MHQYGVRDVEKLLRLPRSAIHGLIKAGFVSPRRGPRKAYLFSFQDLIVLRTAQTLAAANVPAKRIAKSLKELRRQIPDTMPLSGLAISAVGDRVVVKEGANRYHVESGQYVLSFDGDPTAGRIIDTEDILREIRKMNRLRQIVIHTISFGASPFLKTLAAQIAFYPRESCPQD